MSINSDPRIGIALGGGSARGLIHIPFIEAMDEMGLRPSAIAGTSIGSLIGSGWAAGLSGREIREHTIAVLGSMRAITGRLWSTRFRNFRQLLTTGISMQLDAEDVVDAFVPVGFPDTFEQLDTPFYVVTTDFRSWRQVVYDKGPLKVAISGSIAIPSLFRPVLHDGRLLVDGGVVNPLPLNAAAKDADILIGIDVNGDPGLVPQDRVPSAIETGLGSAQIMMHQLIMQTVDTYRPDVYFRPENFNFGAYEFWRVREILEVGDASKDRFKREVSATIDAFSAGLRKIL